MGVCTLIILYQPYTEDKYSTRKYSPALHRKAFYTFWGRVQFPQKLYSSSSSTAGLDMLSPPSRYLQLVSTALYQYKKSV